MLYSKIIAFFILQFNEVNKFNILLKKGLMELIEVTNRAEVLRYKCAYLRGC